MSSACDIDQAGSGILLTYEKKGDRRKKGERAIKWASSNFLVPKSELSVFPVSKFRVPSDSPAMVFPPVMGFHPIENALVPISVADAVPSVTVTYGK
jgi:hypothetical protein